MAQRATIENFSQASRIVKELNISSCDRWSGDEWKEEGLKAFRRAIEDTMDAHVERSRLEALNGGVAAFHKRNVADIYRVVLLDGVALTRKTGAGAVSKPVLVAMGLTHDGRKEVIDFRLAASESEAEWEGFLTGLQGRGLKSGATELVCADGGKGCLKALKTVCPDVSIQWTRRRSRKACAGYTRRKMWSRSGRRRAILRSDGKMSIPRR